MLRQLLLAQRAQGGKVLALGLAVLLFLAGGIQQHLPPGRPGVVGGPHGHRAVGPHHGADVLVVRDALGIGQVGQVAVLGRIAGVGVQLGPVQLKQQLVLLLVEPHPEADVQLLAHLLCNAQQAAGLDLSGVGVGQTGRVAQLQAGPCGGPGHQTTQRVLHGKAAQGARADPLVEDAGGVLGVEDQLVIGFLGRHDAHEPVAADQPEITVRAAEGLQGGGVVELQLRPLHVAVDVVALRPDQRQPALDAAQQLQPVVIDAEALVPGCRQGGCDLSHWNPP